MNFTDQEPRVEVAEGLPSAITGEAVDESMVLQPYDSSILVREKIAGLPSAPDARHSLL
jgi:hypothetical protein